MSVVLGQHSNFMFYMDNLQKGFISKEKVLQYLTEEQIFEIVFGYVPIEYEYVLSPFRVDTRPGCWFMYDIQGKLRFVDFGNPNVINGVRMSNIDCFDAIQVYFKFSNFYKALEFLKHKILEGNLIVSDSQFNKNQFRVERKEFKILFEPRDFCSKDQRFWQPYGISKDNLIEDKVFPVKKLKLLNTKSGDITTRLKEICYVYTRFEEGRKKIYFPTRKGSKRFITNCSKNDIGGITVLPTTGNLLVISKSYKDCRVLKNFGINSVWFHNEGMLPEDRILLHLAKRFKRIVVFFDNDNAGIRASDKISQRINFLYTGKSKSLYLPEHLLLNRNISDPSDMYKKMGKSHIYKFLRENL